MNRSNFDPTHSKLSVCVCVWMRQSISNKWFSNPVRFPRILLHTKGFIMYSMILLFFLLLLFYWKCEWNVYLKCVSRTSILSLSASVSIYIHVACLNSDKVSSCLSFRIPCNMLNSSMRSNCCCRSLILLISRQFAEQLKQIPFTNNSRMIIFHHRSLSRF